jgi:hypothetical protein
MVNNSTNINKTNNHILSQINDMNKKRTMTIDSKIKVLIWDRHTNVAGLNP